MTALKRIGWAVMLVAGVVLVSVGLWTAGMQIRDWGLMFAGLLTFIVGSAIGARAWQGLDE